MSQNISIISQPHVPHPFIPSLKGRGNLSSLFFLLCLLTACAGDVYAPPLNVPGTSISEFTEERALHPDPALDETAISLSFSGGGMRASAFSYGVLQEMHHTSLPGSDKHLTDAVEIVTGVSGGSVTAAYFAWKGDETFPNFRNAFLTQDAEKDLSTSISPDNIVRLLTFGGVNDNSALPVWLDDHVFHGATYADLKRPNQPILWISASDIINRTPFVFSGMTFRPLCSDISKIRLADAVAASAAVPGAFTPINIESFANQCEWKPAISVNEKNLEESYGLQAIAHAIKSYRNADQLRYIKLLDGGLTDNFGVQGLAQVRLLQKEPYRPLHPGRAMRLKRVLFLVVNSGRGPVRGEEGRNLLPPGAFTLAGMVTDAAIDANVHTTYDYFRMVMMGWQKDLVKWRCSQPKEKLRELLGREPAGWKCDDVKFYVTQISFSDAGSEREARLNQIPSRFVLPPEEIDFLIDSSKLALANDETYQAFLKGVE
jgi:NTE family protein